MTDQDPISVYCIVNDSEEEVMDGMIAFFNAEWSCDKCKHIIRKDLSCPAFPAGIPDDIIEREFDHRKPYPNAENPEDNGIRFEGESI
jgi:hypothetical protein